jgi:hypothetical protein
VVNNIQTISMSGGISTWRRKTTTDQR